jgi:hypothetical protein
MFFVQIVLIRLVSSSSFQSLRQSFHDLVFPLSFMLDKGACASLDNENAQQRTYYSCHRPNRRYWWPLFNFLLNAIVLNAFKSWGRLYPLFKLIHSKFQEQIVQMLLIYEAIRKLASIISLNTSEAKTKSSSCEWEHISKRSYCRLYKEKKIKLRKRRSLEKISENLIEKRRTSQIKWQCKICELCCKQNSCWQALHSCFSS